MKRSLLLIFVFQSFFIFSQNNIDQILQLGISNAQKYGKDYFAGVGESVVNAVSNGWFHSAKTRKLFHFEIGIVGNLSFKGDENQSFVFNVNDYDNVTLGNGEEVLTVPNAIGRQDLNDILIVDDGSTGTFEVIVPGGLGDSTRKMVPLGYIQATMGLIRSTEVKARFLPKMNVGNNTKMQLFGVAFQHEITDHIFSLKRWPIRISGLLGFTHVNSFYNFASQTNTNNDQEIKIDTNAWVLHVLASTKLPLVNFYGGLGYYFGSSNANLLGTYVVENGPNATETLLDPIRVSSKDNGVKATIGAKVSFGVFSANFDYSLQDFQNINLGLHVGW